MKKSGIITAFWGIFMMVVPSKMSAQEENGYIKFNVEEAFEDNGFQWFCDAQLLCAGNKEKSNAMTIGWGGIGTLWRKTALTVYVAEKRYTKEFIDNSEYFTVMTFDVKDSKVGFKSDVPKQMYANFPAGIHSMYIGEVVNAWKK